MNDKSQFIEAFASVIRSCDLRGALDTYADKGAGFDKRHGKTVGLSKTLRPVAGLKLWEDMTHAERLQELKTHALNDFKIAVEEAKNPIAYMLDRALDPLDPMSGIYKGLLENRGAQISGNAIKLGDDLKRQLEEPSRRIQAAGNEADANTTRITIYSSHGELSVDPSTGLVDAAASVYYEGADQDLRDIVKFNIEEMCVFWGCEQKGGDILNFGYWDDKNEYSQPELDWRLESVFSVIQEYVGADETPYENATATPQEVMQHWQLVRVDALKVGEQFELRETVLGLEPDTYTFLGDKQRARLELSDGIYVESRFGDRFVIHEFIRVRRCETQTEGEEEIPQQRSGGMKL